MSLSAPAARDPIGYRPLSDVARDVPRGSELVSLKHLDIFVTAIDARVRKVGAEIAPTICINQT